MGGRGGGRKSQSKRLGAKHYRVGNSRTVSGTAPQENNCATNRKKDAVEVCCGFGNCTHAMSAKTMLRQNFGTKTLSSYNSTTWNVGSTIYLHDKYKGNKLGGGQKDCSIPAREFPCTLILILPVIDAGGRQSAMPAIRAMCR
jgi:hypothetical protein